jgi:hypothetical protein
LTLPAGSVSSTGAVLNATVNPISGNSAAWFEWGTTTNYGNTTPAQSLGGGLVTLPFNAAVSGLMAGNTYHFSIVATNEMGVARGQDASFRRASAPLRITSLTHPNDGSFPIRFDGVAGQVYFILRSSDLVNWTPIGDATELGSGRFEFIDIGDSGDSTRFYLIGSP